MTDANTSESACKGAIGPLLLAAVSLHAVLTVPSGGMVYAIVLAQVVWIAGHARRFRARWSPTGHRTALATAGGLVGVVLGLALGKHSITAGGWVYVSAGWPFATSIGRTLQPDSPIASSHYGGLPFIGPCIEDAFGCLANFLFWTGATALVVACLPRRWCERVTAVTRYLPVVLSWIVLLVSSPVVTKW